MLGIMAWELAWFRVFGVDSHPASRTLPRSRGSHSSVYQASAEFYRILDRIERGEQP